MAFALTGRAGGKVARLVGRRSNDPSPLDLNNRIIRAGAQALGCEVEDLPNGFLKISRNGQFRYSRSADCPFESLTAWQLCGDKALTQIILTDHGLPVPASVCIDRRQSDEARRFMAEQDGAVVTKPVGGAGGNGVTTGIRSDAELIRGLARAYASGLGRLMVERHVEGRHFRITILDANVINVVERTPAYVVGDGQSSVGTLIEQANRRAGEPGNPQICAIPVDRDTHRSLRRRSRTLHTVPAEGEHVALREVCNADQGGQISDVTARTHCDYTDLALAAAHAMGARLAGVDLIATDIESPRDDGNCWINEVNTTPALYVAEAPDAPAPVRLGERIVERMFSDGGGRRSR